MNLQNLKDRLNDTFGFVTYECPECGMDEQTGAVCRYCGASLRPEPPKKKSKITEDPEEKPFKIRPLKAEPADSLDPTVIDNARTIKVLQVQKPSFMYFLILIGFCGMLYGLSYIPFFEKYASSILIFFLMGFVLIFFYLRNLFFYLFIRLCGKKKSGVLLKERFRSFDSTVHSQIFVPGDNILYAFSKTVIDKDELLNDNRDVMIKVRGHRLIVL